MTFTSVPLPPSVFLFISLRPGSSGSSSGSTSSCDGDPISSPTPCRFIDGCISVARRGNRSFALSAEGVGRRPGRRQGRMKVRALGFPVWTTSRHARSRRARY